MKNIRLLSCVLALLALANAVRADTLELKNGGVLEGKYLGGTADTVRFETSTGMQIFAYSEIKHMSVTPVAPAPTAAATPITVVLQTGTRLTVTMMDSVSSKSAPGTNFTTKLAYDLVANGVVVVKAGTVIYGKVESATQAGRLVGQSTLDIRLTQMMVPDGSAIPILTTSYAQAGQSEGRESVAAAGVGAIIGNNTGNGSQGKGAAYGLAAAALRPGQTLTVPPGTLVEFSLRQPVTFELKK